MDPLDYRLVLYTGIVSRQIMAHQVRESCQPAADVRADDLAEWARPAWLWSVATVLGGLGRRLRRSEEAAVPVPVAGVREHPARLWSDF